MATIYRCDRCGDDQKYERQITKVTVQPMSGNITRTDVCEDCRNQLLRWLKAAPPTAVKAA